MVRHEVDAPGWPDCGLDSTAGDGGSVVLAFENLELRPAELQVLVDGQRLALTVREFEVLFALVQRPDRIVRRTQLYEQIWREPMQYRERAVDVYVRKVRIKLAAAAPGWAYIHTHFGLGYRFAPERQTA